MKDRVEPVESTRRMPVERPLMLQGWHDLTSVHWAYPPDAVQALLPDGLEVDVHGGVAWVGLIPFHMRRIRLPGLPPLGRWSTFPETNVRTYVIAPDGRRAVWFLSLDISRLLPAIVARVGYGLPYHWGPMEIARSGDDTIEYVSERRWPRRGARSRMVVRVGDPIADPELTSLERFVTARWALASELLGVGLWAEVDHPAWPLHRAELLELDQDLIAATGLPAPTGEPVVLWSPGVEVRIGRPVRGSRRTGPAARCAPAPASR
jgi:uncharacterized protein YqjF (DUF2071 family)